jgi:hypothetical protein
MAYRVVADHIRTLSFAIADGSCPGRVLETQNCCLPIFSTFPFIQLMIYALLANDFWFE